MNGFGFGLGVIVVALIGGLFWAFPVYNVWQQELAGRADLVRAEQDRQIMIEEAKATLESAEFLRQAEVTRARGVKEANDIVAEGFGGPGGYLSYLYITGALTNTENNIIYVPTEAGLPILEAGRFNLNIEN